jgi:hypothetical protein
MVAIARSGGIRDMSDDDGLGPEPQRDLTIVGLASTYEAFGLVMDFLARVQPFSDFQVGKFAAVIQQQLASGHNLAALDANQQMVGYAGWIHTSSVSAEQWMADNGPLQPLDGQTHDAAALTVVAATDSRATPRLMRGARSLNPGVRVYFKRGYDGEVRGPKKVSVLNFSTNT